MDVQSVVDQIDRRFLVDTLVEIAQVPCDVPMGEEVFIEPDDPKLVHYVQQVLRPKLAAAGAYDLIDVPGNQIVARYGEGRTGEAVLVQVYTAVQHHNLMDDPWSGKVARATEWGHDEPCVFGQGVTQNKGHQAIALTLLKLLNEHEVPIAGTLYVAINNEGRSSHACTNAVLDALDTKPGFGFLMTRTNEAISMGNRGRVDANVTVKGKAVHSSVPHTGLSAIEGAWRVMERLKTVTFGPEHEILGGRHVVPYQITYSPLAPHTLPDTAKLRVDRRLLPGDDPTVAVDEVRAAIGDLSPYEVTVEEGHHMLPALVDPDHPGVAALKSAHRAVHGEDPGSYYGQGTFDAGGPCAAGVPAIMYGVGGGAGVLDVDYAPLSHLYRVADVLTRTVLELVGK